MFNRFGNVKFNTYKGLFSKILVFYFSSLRLYRACVHVVLIKSTRLDSLYLYPIEIGGICVLNKLGTHLNPTSEHQRLHFHSFRLYTTAYSLLQPQLSAPGHLHHIPPPHYQASRTSALCIGTPATAVRPLPLT